MTDEQMLRLGQVVSGKSVWALGSGPNLKEAEMLVSHGASSVHAIDKHHRSNSFAPEIKSGSSLGVRVYDCRAYYAEFLELIGPEATVDVAFVKWPSATPQPGIAQLIARAETVVYVGKNGDGTICGSMELWLALRLRSLVDVIPGRMNDMIVYTEKLQRRVDYPRCREELEAVDRW
jgi:hypothetical protein